MPAISHLMPPFVPFHLTPMFRPGCLTFFWRHIFQLLSPFVPLLPTL
jgi:hypothetical protein